MVCKEWLLGISFGRPVYIPFKANCPIQRIQTCFPNISAMDTWVLQAILNLGQLGSTEALLLG